MTADNKKTNTPKTPLENTQEANPRATKEKFLYYFTPVGNEISLDDPLIISELLSEIGNDKYNINLILHTLGGSPYASAKIVELLRKRFEVFRVIIPYWAMSSGTLLSLGSDQIIMSDLSQLGPLDMQVSHPSIEKVISAYDYTNPISYLVSSTNNSGASFYRNIRSESNNKISKETAMQIAYSNAVKLFEPVISKIDPIELSKCNRVLEVAKRYGRDYLLKHSLIPKYRRKPYADALIDYLTFDYPDHSFGIFQNEAKDLGLNIIPHDKYPYWDQIWEAVSNDIKEDIELKTDKTKVIRWLELNEEVQSV